MSRVALAGRGKSRGKCKGGCGLVKNKRERERKRWEVRRDRILTLIASRWLPRCDGKAEVARRSKVEQNCGRFATSLLGPVCTKVPHFCPKISFPGLPGILGELYMLFWRIYQLAHLSSRQKYPVLSLHCITCKNLTSLNHAVTYK